MLTPLQRRVAKAVRELPGSEGFALAGGAGLVVQGAISRVTNDLDYFAEQPGEVDRFIPVLRASLQDMGLTVDTVEAAPGFVRLIVGDGQDETLVDLAYDTRLFAPVETDFGRVLALDELAADKTLAVFGRAEPRDFVDLFALSQHFSLDRLIELASAKDPGFDIGVFHSALGSMSRHRRSIFQMSDDEYEALLGLVSRWRAELRRSLGRDGPGLDIGP